MLLVTQYKFKGDRSPESTKAMLAVFAERGAASGQVAHYVAADGGGGFIISESDSLDDAYENALHYQQWMEFRTTPIQTIDEALPAISRVFG